jgi:hypothetical protein
LVLEVEGYRVGNIELDGSHLVMDCASASVQIVQKLLMDEEPAEEVADSEEVDADDYVSESLQSESHEDIETAATKGVPRPVAHDWSSTWDIIQIPPYVKQVSFNVSPQDLKPKRAEDLKARFPNVPILTTPAFINPATTDVPEPVPSSTNNLAGSKLAVDSSDYTTSGDARDSTIYKVADCIGLKLGKASRLLWHHWMTKREILPFNATSKDQLNQLYRKLVTVYIHAYHKGELALCYELLLRFQSINFSDRDDLPELTTAVLAFQFLPEKDPLCQWIATLFAFLWQTRLYESRDEVLKLFAEVNSDAFCKFLFAVAWVRDPHTKGHNTAVLDQWCEVHDHENGSAEEASCKMVRDRLKEHLDSIRNKEARDEYEEAKSLVGEYEKTTRRPQYLGNHVVQRTPVSSKKKDPQSSAGPRKRKRG